MSTLVTNILPHSVQPKGDSSYFLGVAYDLLPLQSDILPRFLSLGGKINYDGEN